MNIKVEKIFDTGKFNWDTIDDLIHDYKKEFNLKLTSIYGKNQKDVRNINYYFDDKSSIEIKSICSDYYMSFKAMGNLNDYNDKINFIMGNTKKSIKKIEKENKKKKRNILKVLGLM